MNNIKRKSLSKDISDFAVNPITGNLVKIGSRKYNQLLKDHILKLDPETRKDNIIFDGPADDIIKNKLKKNKNMNLVNKKNKIVEVRRKLTSREQFDVVMKEASKMIKQNMDEFKGDLSEEEIYLKVKKILSQQLIGDVKPKITFKLDESMNNDFDINNDDFKQSDGDEMTDSD